MSVWLFMFSWQSPSLWAMLNPHLTLKVIKCSMREKKGQFPQLNLEVFGVFCYSCLHHSHHFHSFLMVSEMWLPKLIWPFQVQLFISIGQVVSGTSSHPLLYQKKLDVQILYEEWQIKWIHVIESVAKEEWLYLQWNFGQLKPNAPYWEMKFTNGHFEWNDIFSAFICWKGKCKHLDYRVWNFCARKWLCYQWG